VPPLASIEDAGPMDDVVSIRTSCFNFAPLTPISGISA
jgi:hypothetical protein